MGLFLMLAGLVIFPTILSFMLPVVEWMNPWSDQQWWQSVWRFTKWFMMFGCGFFVLLGVGRLLVYSFVKAGLMLSPWQ